LFEVIYNVMYEQGAQFLLRTEGAMAAQYPGKPLWLYADEGFGADNLRVFFSECLVKEPDLLGLVAPVWAAEVCVSNFSVVDSWEIAAFYLPQLVNHTNQLNLTAPSERDYTTIAAWMKEFYREALSADYAPEERSVAALVANGRLYCLEAPVTGICAMGMRIPVQGESYKMGRLNMIYTPPYLRGMGYGKDITAAISALIQSEGRLPVLYARLENENAVRLYRSLGFEEAGRLIEYRFGGR